MRLGGRIAAAVEVLDDTSKRRRPVADALKDWGLAHRFAGSGDRAAIGNIVYDVLRAKRSLGWRMGDDSPRALVLAAIMDNRGLDGAGLAAALEGDRFAPTFPNEATLKRFAEADLAAAPDAVRADLPDWLAAEFAGAFGDDWIEEAAALSSRPPLDIRANTLVATPGAVLGELSPFGAEPAGIAPDGIRIPPIAGDGRHPNVQVEPGFLKGAFEIQDEGSQIAARLVEAAPGETILDICAGAGGKTLALAAAMNGEGRIHAFDSDKQRLAPIYDRLKRAEAANVEVHGPRDDLSALVEAMDRVIVDAPCTGTGTFRRRPDAKWRLAQSAVDKRMGEQDQVLDSAARFVKRGGTLAYITCSLIARENGERVAAFLERHPDFKLDDAEAVWNRVFPLAAGRTRTEAMAGGRTLTLTPRLTGTDGFFFARLIRR